MSFLRDCMPFILAGNATSPIAYSSNLGVHAAMLVFSQTSYNMELTEMFESQP